MTVITNCHQELVSDGCWFFAVFGGMESGPGETGAGPTALRAESPRGESLGWSESASEAPGKSARECVSPERA